MVEGRELSVECQVRIDLGATLKETGEARQALDHLHRAHAIAERIQLPHLAAESLAAIATLLDSQQPETARACRALAEAHNFRPGESVDTGQREFQPGSVDGE